MQPTQNTILLLQLQGAHTVNNEAANRTASEAANELVHKAAALAPNEAAKKDRPMRMGCDRHSVLFSCYSYREPTR